MKRSGFLFPLFLTTLTLATLTWIGCSSAPPPVKENKIREFPDSRSGAITEAQARARAQQIRAVSYQLWFAFGKSAQSFEGRTTLRFELTENASSIASQLPVDFEEGEILGIKINHRTLTDYQRDPHRLWFSLSDLSPGYNEIEIHYRQKPTTTGNGLVRYKDPADDEVYVFTNLEPAYARRVFPCFDQPDLKASFELTVHTPENWAVIANTREIYAPRVDGKRSWQFPPSPRMSTYLFSLTAGPFAFWKSESHGVPLRFFARRSQSKIALVHLPEWKRATETGLTFFSTHLGLPYPFEKYDQVLVPELNSEGMENLAATLLSEELIHPGTLSEDEREGFASTVLHELAHSWFGNLVTLKWWDGIWLNESLATFAGNWAISETPPFREKAWTNFFHFAKAPAYREELERLSLPLEEPVPDTDAASAQFDERNYGKGASILKQLRFSMGDLPFESGLSTYLRKHAYRNAEIEDLFKSLSEFSKSDLKPWSETWFEQAGLDQVRAEWICFTSPRGTRLLQSLKLIPQPTRSASNAKARSHRILVTLWRTPFAKAEYSFEAQYSDVPVEVYNAGSGSGSAPAPKPVFCPQVVLPNSNDSDHVDVVLDQESLETLKQTLPRFRSPLHRALIWQSLWSSVIRKTLSPIEYMEFSLTQLAFEKDPHTLDKILHRLYSASLTQHSALRFLAPTQRSPYLARLETLTLKQLPGASPPLRKRWLETLASLPLSPRGVQALERALWSPGLEESLKWTLTQGLARLGSPRAKIWMQKLLGDEPSEQGRLGRVRVEAAIATPENKAKWFTSWNSPQVPAHLTASERMSSLAEFSHLGEEDLVAPFADQYFQGLDALVSSNAEADYILNFAENLYPGSCDRALSERLGAFISAHSSYPVALTRVLKSLLTREQLCLEIRSKL